MSQSDEGLESRNIGINGGTVAVTASDDGINATAGTEAGGTEQDDGSLLSITGGNVTVTAGSTAATPNGSASFTGGTITVTSGSAGARVLWTPIWHRHPAGRHPGRERHADHLGRSASASRGPAGRMPLIRACEESPITLVVTSGAQRAVVHQYLPMSVASFHIVAWTGSSGTTGIRRTNPPRVRRRSPHERRVDS